MIASLIHTPNTIIPSNIPVSAQAWILAQRIKKGLQPPTLWVVENTQIATQLTQELRNHLGPQHSVLHFPDWETLPYDRYQPHPHTTDSRLKTLHQLRLKAPVCFITNASTLLYKCVSPEWILKNIWQTDARNMHSRAAWQKQLSQLYERVSVLSEEGQYCIRGSIIDVFPIQHPPCRLDFIDDELEEITLLNKDDFSPIRKIKTLNLTPRFEANGTNQRDDWANKLSHEEPAFLKRLKQGAIIPGYHYYLPSYHHDLGSLLDHLPGNTEILIHQSAEEVMHQHWDLLHKRFKIHSISPLFPPEEIAFHPSFFIEKIKDNKKKSAHIAPLTTLPTLKELSGMRTILCSKNSARRLLLVDYLKRHKQTAVLHDSIADPEALSIGFHLLIHPLTESFVVPSWQYYWIREEDLTKTSLSSRHRTKQTTSAPSIPTTQWESFKVGQKVTHRDYGVGLLEDLVHLKEHLQVEAFVKIQYANNKVVYLPIDGLDKLSPFFGEAELDDPGHTRWRQKVQRAKEACELYASHMLQHEVLRHASKASIIEVNEQYELFCKQFYFQETDDQLRATSEILNDLKEPKPMDRLLLGDVGFGKTEVMLRAAFATIMSGFRVIILCPTTILAEQHYQTAVERMSNWPIEIGLISRLKKPSERARTLELFNEAKIDIVFATQAILTSPIASKKLGLIVIDEEHRFGVKDKQKLTDLHPHVHRLSISATPIPRTLQSALQHLRKMSFIQQPPKLRLSVQTIISAYNEVMIEEAIQREMSRGGQVFFIHNDIQTQTEMMGWLQSLFPTLSMASIHGQMLEGELTRIMQDFLSGKHQILISTTLIESGIDIPNANTIIINRADLLGLAQLHQLRGRVGRSNHQGYAYLFHPEHMPEGDAKKRLTALQEHTGLGSGWLLSLKDLEIRGAGSILGEAQSGHIDYIGYGLYQQLFNEAIAQHDPNHRAQSADITLELKVERYIPESYVYDINERMNIYRDIKDTQTPESLYSLEHSLITRYGITPISVANMIAHQQLLLVTRGSSLQSLLKQNDRLLWQWHNHESINSNLLFDWASQKHFDIKFTNNFSFSIASEDDIYRQCLDVFAILTRKD